MRFWRYGMVKKELSPSAIRRSMSHPSWVVEKPKKEFITLRTARMFFVASWSLACVTAVVTGSMLNHQTNLNDKKLMEKRLNRRADDTRRMH